MNKNKIFFVAGMATAGLITALTYQLQTITVADSTEPVPPVATLPAGMISNSAAQSNTPPITETQPRQNPQVSSTETGNDLLQQPDPNPDYATFADRLNEIRNRRQGADQNAQAIYDAMQQPYAWEASDTPADHLPLTQEQAMDGREFIEVNPAKIESLLPGDTLEIQIGQINGVYTAKIDQAMVGVGDSVNWEGHLENVPGLPGKSHVFLTKSGSLIVGGITTPHGHFELEAHNGSGWIVSSKTLFKEPDQLIEVSEEELSRTPAVSEEALAQNDEVIVPLPLDN